MTLLTIKGKGDQSVFGGAAVRITPQHMFSRPEFPQANLGRDCPILIKSREMALNEAAVEGSDDHMKGPIDPLQHYLPVTEMYSSTL